MMRKTARLRSKGLQTNGAISCDDVPVILVEIRERSSLCLRISSAWAASHASSA